MSHCVLYFIDSRVPNSADVFQPVPQQKETCAFLSDDRTHTGNKP